ncbi:MAG: hypothetical protein HKM03_11650 [Steroidobacteraceae bacterium]|nr:hypothetical protein [Steroidobacteraceae bacterium]
MILSSHPSRRVRWTGRSVLLAYAVITAGPAVAAATPSSNLAQRVLACHGVSSDRQRLQCFDRLAAALATSTPDAARSRQSTVTLPDPRQTFGLTPATILTQEFKRHPKQQTISSIAARIVRLQKAVDGRMVYQLSNGQVWEELLDDGYAPPVNVGDTVQISRGWLGSYWMQTPSRRGCKVQRLR